MDTGCSNLELLRRIPPRLDVSAQQRLPPLAHRPSAIDRVLGNQGPPAARRVPEPDAPQCILRRPGDLGITVVHRVDQGGDGRPGRSPHPPKAHRDCRPAGLRRLPKPLQQNWNDGLRLRTDHQECSGGAVPGTLVAESLQQSRHEGATFRIDRPEGVRSSGSARPVAGTERLSQQRIQHTGLATAERAKGVRRGGCDPDVGVVEQPHEFGNCP